MLNTVDGLWNTQGCFVDHSRGVGVSVPRVGLDRAPLSDMEHPFRCGCSGNTTHRV